MTYDPYTKHGMKRVKGPQDVPDVPHYAVIIYASSSVYVEGDQRSRDCPGHGYPAHTETYESFEHWVSLDRANLLEFVKELELEKAKPYHTTRPYVFFKAEGKGHTKTVVEIEP